MRHVSLDAGKDIMNRAKKIAPPSDGIEIFNNFDALTALVQKSFDEAAAIAGAENDSLGIPTHGSIGGKLVVRQPKPKSAKTPVHC